MKIYLIAVKTKKCSQLPAWRIQYASCNRTFRDESFVSCIDGPFVRFFRVFSGKACICRCIFLSTNEAMLGSSHCQRRQTYSA